MSVLYTKPVQLVRVGVEGGLGFGCRKVKDEGGGGPSPAGQGQSTWKSKHTAIRVPEGDGNFTLSGKLAWEGDTTVGDQRWEPKGRRPPLLL